jgi:hypothetical protein
MRAGGPQQWAVGRWLALPPWGQALVVFVACQLVTAVMLERSARFTQVDADHDGQYSYLRFVARWDSAWYRKIAQFGYPQEVPRAPDGHALENPWAFYPLYPMICRAVMAVPGIPWPWAGWLVSIVCAAGAAVLLRALVAGLGARARRESPANRSLALWSVALLAAFPTGAVLQFPYTESLGLLVLLAVLVCLQRRAYALAIPLVLLLGLARPVAIPVAGVVAVHLLLRLRRRDRDPVPAREQALLVTLFGAACAAAVEWPVIAAMVTGDSRAYTDSMAAWRTAHTVTPLMPWVSRVEAYLGQSFGRVVLTVVPIALVWWLTRPRARMLGADLRVWCVCYVAYLLLVLDPTTSLARYLLLLFPLGILLAASSPSVAYRRALVVASFICQLVWIVTVWRVGANPP